MGVLQSNTVPAFRPLGAACGFFLVVLSAVLSATAALAASTAERSPASTAAVGTGLANAANALVCDGAVASSTANNRTQDFSTFGIALPAGATVTGIQVRVRANDGATKNRRFRVQLSWNGGTSFTAELRTPTFKPNAPLTNFYLGGANYLWGRTWTAAELADPNFRVRLLSGPASTADTANLDCLPVTVFYNLPNAPSLNVSKVDAPDPVAQGQTITYTISYTNSGTAAATGVTLTDATPANTTFVSANPAPAGAPPVGGSGTVTWNLGSLPAGGSGVATLVVRVASPLASGTVIAGSAHSIDSNETVPSPGNEVATTVQNNIVLALAKADSPDPVTPSGTLTYLLTYSNQGSTPTSGVVINEAYDPNVVFVSSVPPPDAGTTDQWTIGALAPGASGTIAITAAVASGLPDGSQLSSSASISDVAGNSSDALATTTTQNVISLTVTSAANPDPVQSGAALTYTVTYRNTGTAALNGVRVLETYDRNVAFLGSIPAPDAGRNDTWTVGTLAPGASGSITIFTTTAVGLADGTTITNGAVVLDDSGHSASSASTSTVLGAVDTPTPTHSDTPTITATPTATHTVPPTGTPTATATDTVPPATNSPTATETTPPTATPSSTATGTFTHSPTPTDTGTATVTSTPTFTDTVPPSATPTATHTVPAATGTTTPTSTPTDTRTPPPTRTPTSTPAPPPPCPAEPLSGCLEERIAGQGQLVIIDRPDSGRDKLKWKWAKGEATSLTDLGDPVSTTGYAVCVYADDGGSVSPIFAASVPPRGICGTRPCWSLRNAANGYQYADNGGRAGGVRRIKMNAGPPEQARFGVSAKGAGIILAGLPAAGSTVTAQLLNSDGRCWTASFAAGASTSALRSTAN